ncbi:putative ABC transporter permease [Bifidobacterium bifidum]|uniref:putative ABC transporter permease n=1 Tax=Bifidobacterium bifidum TaxID=1681 RepID=UPI00356A55D4
MFVYALAGLIGTVHKTIWAYLTKGMFEYRNGSILTPFNYVYGLRVGHRHRAAPYRPGVEGRAGRRSWNYANEPLNIGGRTTVPFMLFWGLLCYLIVRFILPLVLWLVHLIDDTWHTRLATILLAWILIDSVVTPPAIFLYGQRANGAVFDNWFAQHIGQLSMTTSCACISRTCACESHRGSSGTIYRPPARSAVMAYGRHARLAPS